MLVKNTPPHAKADFAGREMDFAPYRPSGTVYGVLLNHRPALAALGDAAMAAPYKAAPVAPVLYVKPRNTLAQDGDTLALPLDAESLEVAPCLGIVIGRTACRATPASALEHVAGYALVHDVSVPHDVFYRPSIRFKARDGFCPIGPVVPRSVIADPDSLQVQSFVDGVLQHDSTTGERIRSAAALLADVTDFMTLQPGDVLMLGASWGAPRVRAGQTVRSVIEGVGELSNTVIRAGGVA